MSTAEIQAELHELYTTLRGLQLAGLSAVAALTWVVYDIFVTFADEVNYVWISKWSYPKVLFFLARYYILANLVITISVSVNIMLSPDVCRKWTWFEVFFSIEVPMAIVNQILLLRVNALYGYNKIVLAFLIFCLLGDLIISCVLSGVTIAGTEFISRPLGLPFPGCLAIAPTRLTLLAWVVELFVACAYYGLTVYKLAGFVQMRSLSQLFSGRGKYPIVSAFLRDGSVYFGMVFAAVAINTVATIIGGTLRLNADPWLKATYSVAGSRLILSLRTLSALDSTSKSLDMQSFSGIVVCKPPRRESILLLETGVRSDQTASESVAASV